MSLEPCPGIDLVRGAENLADLLFRSPDAWLHRPLLMRRTVDGRWRNLDRMAVQQRVQRVAAWLEAEGVGPGDRIGLLGHNSIEWFIADFAILRLGAVVVPAYYTDPAEAVQYIFDDAGCRLVLVEPGEQHKLEGVNYRVLPLRGVGASLATAARDSAFDDGPKVEAPGREALATLIYTSGTTGNPKGVMLTHGNLLTDIEAGLGGVPIWPEDLFLSFLPVSHAFERTIGHLLPCACGAGIAYASGLSQLLRDIGEVQPTVMISVPRLYEKIYAGVLAQLAEKPRPVKWLFALCQRLGMERFELAQGGRELPLVKGWLWQLLDPLVNGKLRQKLGGRLRLFISGGAALNPAIARFLLASGVTVLPGYGLTEASPVLAVNREGAIRPEAVGPALPLAELKLADDGELLARGPMIMQGYWQRPEETAAAFFDGWLRTGDLAEIDADGYVRIIDRKKEIMVLSNGENVPPATIEQHLVQDPCILQAMVIAENRPHVVALIVPDEAGMVDAWRRETGEELPEGWLANAAVHEWMLQRMRLDEHDLPSYMQVRDFAFVDEEWTQEEGELTPTMKLKRRRILERYQALVDTLDREE